MSEKLTALERDVIELAVQKHCCERALEHLEEEEDTAVVIEQRRQNEAAVSRLQSLIVFRRAPHRMPLACVRRMPTPRASRASRRTLRRSAHGPPGRRSSDDDPSEPPPPLGRRRHALARLRLLVDAYVWPSRVWKRIARTLERERGQ